MKKLLLGLFAAGMIFTACEKDEIDALNDAQLKTEQEFDNYKVQTDAQIAALNASIDEVAANLQDAKDELAAADASNTALIIELEASVEAYVAQFTQLLIAKEAEFLALLAAEAEARAAGDNSLTEGLLSLDAKVDGYVAEFTAILIEKEALYLSLLSDNAVASTQYTDAEIDSLKVYVDNGFKLLREELDTEIMMLQSNLDAVEDASITGVSITGNVLTVTLGDESTETLDLGHLNESIRSISYDEATDEVTVVFAWGHNLDGTWNTSHVKFSLTNLQAQITDNAGAIQSLTASLTMLQEQVNAIDFIDTTELNKAIENLNLSQYAADSDLSSATGRIATLESAVKALQEVDYFTQEEFNTFNDDTHAALNTQVGKIQTALNGFLDGGDPTYTQEKLKAEIERLEGLINALTATSASYDSETGQLTINFAAGEPLVTGDLRGDEGQQGLKGLKGDTGAQGLMGLRGLPGLTGAQGVGISSVSYDESTGILTINFTDDSEPFVTGDLRGEDGEDGEDFDSSLLVFSYDADSGVLSISYDGTSLGQTGDLRVQGPMGLRGEIGGQGEVGPAGQSAYALWLTVSGNEGKTIEEFLTSLIGERGPQGEAATPLTVTNVNASSAGVTITFSDNTEVFVANGQQGVKGDTGNGGADGYSISYSVASATTECENGGFIVTISSTDPDVSNDVRTVCNGVDGDQGPKGDEGDQGDQGTDALADEIVSSTSSTTTGGDVTVVPNVSSVTDTADYTVEFVTKTTTSYDTTNISEQVIVTTTTYSVQINGVEDIPALVAPVDLVETDVIPASSSDSDPVITTEQVANPDYDAERVAREASAALDSDDRVSIDVSGSSSSTLVLAATSVGFEGSSSFAADESYLLSRGNGAFVDLASYVDSNGVLTLSIVGDDVLAADLADNEIQYGDLIQVSLLDEGSGNTVSGLYTLARGDF